jgi:hypothetical protein
MAGGMTSGRGMSLADRSARSGIGAATAAPPQEESPRQQEVAGSAHVQHCWVVDAPTSPGRWPGLLTEWRRDGAGRWEGRVVWAVEDDGGAVLIEAWVQAGYLSVARTG